MNLYKILDVNPSASRDEIKKQYRFLIQAYHPDKFVNEKEKNRAEEKTKEINYAYTILSDPRKRKLYDEKLQESRKEYRDCGNYKPEASNWYTKGKDTSSYTNSGRAPSGENVYKTKKYNYSKPDSDLRIRFHGLKLIGVVIISVLCIGSLMILGMGASNAKENDQLDESYSNSNLTEVSSSKKTPTSMVKNTLGPNQGDVLGDPFDYFRSSCVNWATVSPKDVGKELCVYGTVHDSYWGEDIFFIRFSETPSAFRFIVSNGYYFKDIDDRCIYATGEIKSFGDLPYLELDDRVYYCDYE